MKELVLEIIPGGLGAAFAFVDGDEVDTEKEYLGPPGVTLRLVPGIERRSAGDGHETLKVVLRIAEEVGTGLVSAWLWGRMTRKRFPIQRATIRINRRELTELTADSLRHAIEEEIEMTKEVITQDRDEQYPQP
jgi:hypothetical protein